MERRQYLVWHNWGFDPFTNRIMHILNVEFVSLFSGDIYLWTCSETNQKLLRYGTQCSIMSMSIIAQKRTWRGLRCGSCCVCNNNLEGRKWCHNVKVHHPGIEPRAIAWKATMLPLHQWCYSWSYKCHQSSQSHIIANKSRI